MSDNKAEFSVLVCTVCGHELALFGARAVDCSCVLCDAALEHSEPLTWAFNFSLKHELSADADEELAERMRHA